MVLNGKTGEILWQISLLSWTPSPRPASVLTLNGISVFMLWGQSDNQTVRVYTSTNTFTNTQTYSIYTQTHTRCKRTNPSTKTNTSKHACTRTQTQKHTCNKHKLFSDACIDKHWQTLLKNVHCVMCVILCTYFVCVFIFRCIHLFCFILAIPNFCLKEEILSRTLSPLKVSLSYRNNISVLYIYINPLDPNMSGSSGAVIFVNLSVFACSDAVGARTPRFLLRPDWTGWTAARGTKRDGACDSYQTENQRRRVRERSSERVSWWTRLQRHGGLCERGILQAPLQR